MSVFRAIVVLIFGLGLVACSKGPGHYSQQGLERLEAGKASEASRRFGRALQMLEPQDEAAGLWNALGVSAALTGREEEAEQAFQTALQLDPSLWVAHVNIGILFRGQARTEEAVASFTTAMNLMPQRTEVFEFLAAESLRSGDRQQAVVWMEEAVRQNPTARSLSSLAVMTVDLQTVEERKELLLEAVAMDPRDAAAQVNLAALLDQHRFDAQQAELHYEAFLRLSPDSPLVTQVQQRIQVMEARATSGMTAQPDPVRDEVEALLAQAAQASDPRQALALCLRAHATAARASRVVLRERALRAGATLAPSSPRAFVGLGRLLEEQGRFEEALTVFQEAHQLAPTWEPAWSGVASSMRSLGQETRARRFLESIPTPVP